MADSSSFKDRLTSYHPGFDRVLFGVALLGVLVAVHLVIQQGRGFDRGCLGFSEPAAAAQAQTFNCEMVTQSGAGTLLGVSNAWWGIGFYLAVAGLSVAAASLKRQRVRFAATRAVLIGGGLLYSAYLTYHQFAGLGALCALCLTSAALALVLFLVQAALFARPAAPDASSSKTTAMPASTFRPARWGAAAVALVVLIGADVAYFSSLDVAAAETAAATQTETATQEPPPARNTAAPEPASTPAAADTTEDQNSNAAALPAGCRFSPSAQPMEASRMVNFGDPVFGAADASVTVVEFFDPNCPHCKTFHNTMKNVQAQYGDRARFVYKPIPLWPRSVNQVAALHAAQQQGKFMEMLEAQFARQQRSGLSTDQLASVAREIGMNAGAMRSQIRQNRYQQQIQQARALAKAAGVRGTPAVSVNGRLVGRRAKTSQCVSAMIERELESS